MRGRPAAMRLNSTAPSVDNRFRESRRNVVNSATADAVLKDGSDVFPSVNPAQPVMRLAEMALFVALRREEVPECNTGASTEGPIVK